MEEYNALILKYCLKIVIDKAKNIECAGFSHSFYPEHNIIALINTTTKECLSSIMFKIEPPYVRIDSTTAQEHQGLKYNTLLRAALILHLKDASEWYIVSFPVNPVSLYVSMKYFNFKFWHESDNPNGLITSENITFDLAEKNLQKWIKCDLSDKETIVKANDKFIDISMSGLLSICPRATGTKRKRKMKRKRKSDGERRVRRGKKSRRL
jgi:hypothetical protein